MFCNRGARPERCCGDHDTGLAGKRLLCAGRVVRASREHPALTCLRPTTRVLSVPRFKMRKRPPGPESFPREPHAVSRWQTGIRTRGLCFCTSGTVLCCRPGAGRRPRVAAERWRGGPCH